MAINKNVLAEKQATVLSEDGNTMYATIQMRHGKESEMDKSKFVPAEIGVTTDTKKAFMAFSPGNVKEMMFREDSEIEELLGEVRKISDQAVEAVESAEATAKQTIEDYTEQMKATIPEDYTEMVKKVDILERTKAPAIHQTAIGNPITLTDAAEGTPVVDFAMDGKTEQVQTTGAQLFDASKLKTKTQGNVTITNNGDGSFTVTGSGNVPGTEYPSIMLSKEESLKLIKPGTLRLAENSDVRPRFMAGLRNTQTNTFRKTVGNQLQLSIEITEDDIQKIESGQDVFSYCFFDNADVQIVPGTIKPMVYIGDNPQIPWEPYTGRQPSPSPDYPQEIVNGGNYNDENQKWEYEVSIKGKNLAKVVNFSEATIAGVKVIVDKNGRYKLSGVVTENLVYRLNQPSGIDFGNFPIIFTLKAGHKYRIMDTQLFTRRNNGTTATTGITEPSDMGGNGIIYEPTQDFGVIGIRIYIKNGATYNDSTLYTPGVWEDPNGTDTTWEPYRIPQSLTLTSDRPLTKWDRLEKRDGQWGWVFKSNEKILDGSETWYTFINNSDVTTYYVMLQNKTIGFQTSYCDKYRNVDYAYNSNDYGIYSDNSVNTRMYFRPISSDIANVTEFKSWIQSNPLTIWYETAEETFVPLTESEQTDLEALTTYFPTTIIANDADCEMEIEYVADTKKYIDDKFAELAQNLAATQNTLLEV